MHTERTRQAFERMERVPTDRQDQLAALLLHEIAEDERWAGRCPPVDPDRL